MPLDVRREESPRDALRAGATSAIHRPRNPSSFFLRSTRLQSYTVYPTSNLITCAFFDSAATTSTEHSISFYLIALISAESVTIASRQRFIWRVNDQVFSGAHRSFHSSETGRAKSASCGLFATRISALRHACCTAEGVKIRCAILRDAQRSSARRS